MTYSGLWVLGKLGPGQLGPGQLSALWKWQIGPGYPGSNCPPWKSGKLGPGQLPLKSGQLGPGPLTVGPRKKEEKNENIEINI